MLQKTRIAAMLANVWTGFERLEKYGAIKNKNLAGHFSLLENIDKATDEELKKTETHFRSFCQTGMVYVAEKKAAPAKDGKPAQEAKPANGILFKLVSSMGFGEIQATGSTVSAIHFKMGLTSTKVLEDFVAVLKVAEQDAEITDCLEVGGLTPTLKGELILPYPLSYSGHDWCGNLDEMLSGVEKAASRAKRLGSIIKWLQSNLTPEQTGLVERQHIYLKMHDVVFDGDLLIGAKFDISETPGAIKQREIKAAIDKALKDRTKKVLGLEMGPEQIKYELEGEPNPVIIELDIITGW